MYSLGEVVEPDDVTVHAGGVVVPVVDVVKSLGFSHQRGVFTRETLELGSKGDRHVGNDVAVSSQGSGGGAPAHQGTPVWVRD